MVFFGKNFFRIDNKDEKIRQDVAFGVSDLL